jgi:hypothetical protein
LPHDPNVAKSEKIADLLFDVSGIRFGGGDPGAEGRAVAAAQAVNGDLHGAFGPAELRGDFGVGSGATVGSQGGSQGVEQLRLARAGVFGP